MWPEIEKLLTNQQLNDFDNLLSDEIQEFVKTEKIDEQFLSSFKTVYLPLAKWIESKHEHEPVIIGINGAQGSGKSTLSKLLRLILERLFDINVLHLSIDDLYLSRSKRLSLANSIHPMLKVRGVPGTHNVELGISILSSIKQSLNFEIKIPVFDKAIDDLASEDQWSVMNQKVDVVLFEGWCVDAKPQPEHELIQPVNQLEAIEDTKLVWRTYVNKQLAEKYTQLFSCIDYLIMLEVPDMDSVYKWRAQQEKKLKNKLNTAKQTMSESEIRQFIMYFERITKACLNEMPERADVLLKVNKAHQIVSVKL